MQSSKHFENRVRMEVRNQIAFVSLDRSDKLNALDYPMFQGLIQAAKAIKKNKQLRAVVLRGEGEVFCSGLDVKSMFSSPMKALQLLVKTGTKASNLAQDVSLVWRELPIPVIAVLQGKCWGGGYQIALGADFRYATPDCEFSIMETRWGLVPDMSGNIALRELAPIDIIKQLTMTAEVFDAETAKAYNLITAIHDDPMQAAISFANQLKERSPDAVSLSKKLINDSWSASIKEVLRLETRLQRKLIGRKNQRIAIKRNQESGRKTEFVERS